MKQYFDYELTPSGTSTNGSDSLTFLKSHVKRLLDLDLIGKLFPNNQWAKERKISKSLHFYHCSIFRMAIRHQV